MTFVAGPGIGDGVTKFVNNDQEDRLVEYNTVLVACGVVVQLIAIVFDGWFVG